MKRASASIALVIILVTATTSLSSAAVYLGWADEFIGGYVDCSLDSALGTNGCHAHNFWAGQYWLDPSVFDTNHNPTWSYVGQQGGNTTGRANAKEKIMFSFREASNTATGSATTSLSRFRVTSPPADGSACSAASGVFIGSVSQTLDSGSTIDADWKFNSRLLPVYDFAAETATGGAVVGYKTNLTITNMAGQSATKTGCYKIKWN